MEWPESLADDLPERRDDIVDELSDHLNCALAKERRSTSDEIAARDKVLVRFGDPARIARQLWFDSMKGKLMRQRLAVFGCVLLTLLSLGGVAVLWQRSEAEQQLNRAMFEQLAALVKQQNVETRSLEWNPLKVRCVLDTADGKPGEGIKVIANGHFLSSGENVRITKTTGSDGIADFGLVRPCQAQLDIKTAWNERTEQSVTISPGQDHVETVICPAAPLPQVNAEYEIDWPKQLQDKGLALVAGFRLEPRKVGQQFWRTSARGGICDFAHVISGPGPGQFANYADVHSANVSIRVEPDQLAEPIRQQRAYLLARNTEQSFKPYNTGEAAKLTLLGIIRTNYHKRFKIENQKDSQNGWFFLAAEFGLDGNVFRDRIEAIPGKPNHWRINPPEKLWEDAWLALKEQTELERILKVKAEQKQAEQEKLLPQVPNGELPPAEAGEQPAKASE